MGYQYLLLMLSSSCAHAQLRNDFISQNGREVVFLYTTERNGLFGIKPFSSSKTRFRIKSFAENKHEKTP